MNLNLFLIRNVTKLLRASLATRSGARDLTSCLNDSSVIRKI